MEHTTSSTRRPRTAILAGTAVIAIAAIVYFSFFYPPTKSDEVSGTIGAVKKYRSEQITEKDVNLASQQSDAIAVETAADNQAATELAATATTFEKTYHEFSNRYALDKTMRDQFERTISYAKSVSEGVLAQRQIESVGKTAQVSQYDKSAGAQQYDKAAGAQQYQKSMPALEKNAKEAFNRAAVEQLSKDIKSFDARIKEMAARPEVGKMAKLDKTATIDMRAGLSTLENRISVYQKNFQPMENRAGLENRTEVGNKAQ